MRTAIFLSILSVMVCGLASYADEYVPSADKFKACENKAGEGFFWVDTTSGKTWWAEPRKIKWVFYGKPEGAESGPSGTYIPYENKSGKGLFVLNTATGEGWWTDGKVWKKLGIPRGTEKSKNKNS